MDEFVLRLAVVVGIAAIAAGAAFVSRRGRAWRRRQFEPTDLEPGFHLFSSDTCRSCARARAAIERTGLSFSEHTYESDAQLLARNGIERVPTIAWVPPNGRSGWIAEGVPSERMLARRVGP